jgi:GAF domain-containing protein
MRGRGKAGGEPARGRRGKTVAPKASKKLALSVLNDQSPEQFNRLKRERDEALEQLAATSDVLRVISRAPTELQSVLDTIGENAARLCNANNAVIFRLEGNVLRQVASYGGIPTTSHPNEGLPANRDTVSGRTVCDRRTVHVPDLASEDREYPLGSRHAKSDGHRTTLATPLMREGIPIGAILIRRMEVRPFSEKQIALLETFAAQAVIAIENTRLLNELRQRTADLSEALDQQTATADVLRVISSSPHDVKPVFEAMLDKATRLCEAKFGHLYLWDGEAFNIVAMRNTPPALADVRQNVPILPGSNEPLGRMVATKSVIHIADTAAEQSYIKRSHPAVVTAVELGGIRTLVAVPMLKDNDLVGAFTIYRQEVRPFTDKQIDLVKTFAAQAVIAIENARLLNELRQRTDELSQRTDDLTEALEQQTATSEVLQVISSSPGELEAVFDAMLANATTICEAKFGHLFLREGEDFRVVAVHGEQSYVNFWRRNPAVDLNPGSPLARLANSKQIVHIADLRADQSYIERKKRIVALVETAGARTLVVVPMLRGRNSLARLPCIAKKSGHSPTSKSS